MTKFEELWVRVRKNVQANASRMATEWIAAEDIQQQTAINLWLYLEKHGPDAVNPETLSSWIRQVTKRAFYYLARERHKPRSIGTGGPENTVNEDGEANADQGDDRYGHTDPDTTYDLQEWLAKTLTPGDRDLFMALAEADNQDLCEVSKKLNIPIRNGYPKELCRRRGELLKKIVQA